MLTYDLDARGSLPLYEYLYRCIRQDILDGTLAAGTRLPSKRALADHLRLSVITVEGAYQQLEAEGYVYVLPRRGFFVAAVERPAVSSPPPAIPPEQEHSWYLDLGQTRTDPAHFPTATWARLTRQVLSEGNFLAPVPHQGLYALRQAIARDLRNSKGMSVAPEQIVVGAGAEYLYLLLAQLLKGGVFAVEDPGYPKIRQVYERCGIQCRPVPLDGQGLNPQFLPASGVSAIHISPAHHYPTGQVMSIGRRQALLRWAEETGGIIIEDDYDSELRFTGRPIPTLQSIDTCGRVIYVNTFSQTISPSMRVGFMVLPPALLERYRRELGFYACTVPTLDQHVLARFLDSGHYEQHLARMRKEYRARRARVIAAFQKSAFASRISISEAAAGLHFLLHLTTDEPDDTIRRRGRDHGVRLVFLADCAAISTPSYAHTLVVNYAGVDPVCLEENMSLLERILFP